MIPERQRRHALHRRLAFYRALAGLATVVMLAAAYGHLLVATVFAGILAFIALDYAAETRDRLGR